MRFLQLLCVSSMAATLSGQVVVPPLAPTSDAAAIGTFAGLGSGRRQAFLVHDSQLVALRNKTITGLCVRRDSRYAQPLQGGAIDLVLRASVTSMDPGNPAEGFAANHQPGTPIEVFAGLVQVPSSPAVSQPHDGWAPHNSIRIVFTTPLPYTSGNLCMEATGRPAASGGTGFWPVDYESDGVRGTATSIGGACAGFAAPLFKTATASLPTLRAGATARFAARGRPNTPGVVLIGGSLLPTPIDLSWLGATQCRLYVAPLATMGTSFASVGLQGGPGVSNVRLHVPGQPAFMGARFYLQWANLEISLPPPQWSNPFGLTTSNALEITLATDSASPVLATIDSPVVTAQEQMPNVGRILIGRAPVMLLLHR